MRNNDTIAYIISESQTVSKHKILNTESCDTAIVEAELQDASEFNRNKRNYSHDVLDDGLNKPNIKELISRKSWVGEAGHPMNATLARQMTIDHERISHRILKWWWEGDKVKGIVETLPTRFGREMRDVIRCELESAYSLRAVGPVKRGPKGDIVQKPLTIMTYDWVFLPSHRKSYQTKILKEGFDLGTEEQQLSEAYCIPILNEQALDYIKEESKNYKLISEFYDMKNGVLTLNENHNGVIYTTSDGKTTNKMHMKIEDHITREISHGIVNIFK